MSARSALGALVRLALRRERCGACGARAARAVTMPPRPAGRSLSAAAARAPNGRSSPARSPVLRLRPLRFAWPPRCGGRASPPRPRAAARVRLPFVLPAAGFGVARRLAWVAAGLRRAAEVARRPSPLRPPGLASPVAPTPRMSGARAALALARLGPPRRGRRTRPEWKGRAPRRVLFRLFAVAAFRRRPLSAARPSGRVFYAAPRPCAKSEGTSGAERRRAATRALRA